MEIWESFSQLLLEILELEPETIIYVHKDKSQAFDKETGNTVIQYNGTFLSQWPTTHKPSKACNKPELILSCKLREVGQSISVSLQIFVI